jgi:hypothetical protein
MTSEYTWLRTQVKDKDMSDSSKRTDFRAWLDLLGRKVKESEKYNRTVEVGYAAPYAVFRS